MEPKSSAPPIVTPPSTNASTKDLQALEHRVGRHAGALWVLFILWILSILGLVWLHIYDVSTLRQQMAAQIEALNKRVDNVQPQTNQAIDDKVSALGSRVDDLTTMLSGMQQTLNGLKTAQEAQTPPPSGATSTALDGGISK